MNLIIVFLVEFSRHIEIVKNKYFNFKKGQLPLEYSYLCTNSNVYLSIKSEILNL